jgi:hypothetical protein
MAKSKNTSPDNEISDVIQVTTTDIDFCVLGTSPLVLNRMSEKAKHELLMPKGRKNAAERATSLKHVPIDEYRASAYTMKEGPTLLAMMATAFKGALRSAALDMPGMKKAQIGRLTYVPGDLVGVYGIPQLFMAIVRSADMNRTPDVRTRAIVPHWACMLRVTYTEPLIRHQAVSNLLAAAGITIGVGDGRPEKGAMSYGQFKLVGVDNADFKRIVKEGGRKAQIAALDKPECYDTETEELLTWFNSERSLRQLKGVA